MQENLPKKQAVRLHKRIAEDNIMSNIKKKVGFLTTSKSIDDVPFKEGNIIFNKAEHAIYVDLNGERTRYGCDARKMINEALKWYGADDEEEEEKENDPDYNPQTREGLDYSPYLDKLLEVEGYNGKKIDADKTDTPIDYRPFLRKIL